MDWLSSIISGWHPVQQALLATLFTWSVTALGASLVFLFKNFKQKLLDSMMGFAAGVMLAASFWSLLLPAIEASESVSSLPKWFPPLVGFLCGGLFMVAIDKVLPHLHPGLEKAEGISTGWQRSILLVLALCLVFCRRRHDIRRGGRTDT